MVDILPKTIKDKIETFLGNSGITFDENVIYQNVQLTGMPQDDFITSAFARRAKEEANDIPENYRCFACGRTYMDRNEFVACMQDHVKDFMAGIPIDVLPEYEDQQIQSFTPDMQRRFYELKKEGLTNKPQE